MLNYYIDTAQTADTASRDRARTGGASGEYYSKRETRIPAWLLAGDTHTAARLAGLTDAQREAGDADAETVARWLDDGICVIRPASRRRECMSDPDLTGTAPSASDPLGAVVGESGMVRLVSTPASRAGLLRGALVGGCSALVTALAHTAGGGGIPMGAALVELIIMCATVGMSAGAINVRGRYARVSLTMVALCAAQFLGHLMLTSVGGHHHSGWLLTTPMLALHAIAAVGLGLLISAVEYLYVVCSFVLSWLRLFATDVQIRSAPKARRYSNIFVLEPVLMRAGLGMRAPPALPALVL